MEKEEYEFTIETTDTPLMDDSQTVDTDKKIFAEIGRASCRERV